jgi:hypothetical protein
MSCMGQGWFLHSTSSWLSCFPRMEVGDDVFDAVVGRRGMTLLEVIATRNTSAGRDTPLGRDESSGNGAGIAFSRSNSRPLAHVLMLLFLSMDRTTPATGQDRTSHENICTQAIRKASSSPTL